MFTHVVPDLYVFSNFRFWGALTFNRRQQCSVTSIVRYFTLRILRWNAQSFGLFRLTTMSLSLHEDILIAKEVWHIHDLC